MKRLMLLFIASAAVLISCHRDAAGIPDVSGTLVLNPGVADPSMVKSRISVSENKISEVSVAIYNDSCLVGSIYTDDVSSISFPSLHIGEDYEIYAAFNAGSLTFPAAESELSLLQVTWDSSSIGTMGFPMAWTGEVSLVSDGQNVVMEAERLVSKVTFSVDNAGLSDHKGTFTVLSAVLKNSARTIGVFSGSDAARGEKDWVSDSATDSDIISVNEGGSISFYAFENRGGTLLPDNTDPWNKVPSGIGAEADRCTYLEVTGTYSTDGGACTAPVTYRMYLGEDITTNFDLRRNCIYDVTLMPSDESIDRTSWRITRGSFSDSRSLTFTPASVTMNVNACTTFTVTPDPSDMSYTVNGGSGFGDATLSIVATGSPGEYSLVSSGTLTADAVTSVTATSWDGRVTATMPVTVKAKVLKYIMLTPAEVTKAKGEIQVYTVTAVYDKGGTEVREDVTYLSSITSSDTTVAAVGGVIGNIVTAVDGGTAVITASYSGKTATASFFCRAINGWEILFDGSNVNYAVGLKNVGLSARATYNDGTEEIITSDLSFTSTAGTAANLSGTTLQCRSSTTAATESCRLDLTGRTFKIQMYYKGSRVGDATEFTVWPKLSSTQVTNIGTLYVGKTTTFSARVKVGNYFNGVQLEEKWMACSQYGEENVFCGCTVYNQSIMSFLGKGTATLRGLQPGTGLIGVYFDACRQHVTATQFNVTVYSL